MTIGTHSNYTLEVSTGESSGSVIHRLRNGILNFFRKPGGDGDHLRHDKHLFVESLSRELSPQVPWNTQAKNGVFPVNLRHSLLRAPGYAAIAKRMNAKDRPNLTGKPWTTVNLRKFMTKMKSKGCVGAWCLPPPVTGSNAGTMDKLSDHR